MGVVKDFANMKTKGLSRVAGGLNLFGSQAEFTDLDYRKIAREAYEKNPFVYAGLNLAANAFAGVKPVLFEIMPNGERKMVKRHPALDLLARPNEEQGREEFLKEAYLYWRLSGKNFTHILAPDRGVNAKKPRFLYNIQPDLVKVKASQVDPVSGFVVETSDKRRELGVDEVIYTKDFHPLNQSEGHPAINSSMRAVDNNNAMMAYNLSVMKSGGIPPLAIFGATTEEQVNQMREGWQRNYGGWRNAGQPFFPRGDVEIKKLGDTNKDMEWAGGIEVTGKLILMTLGIPPEMVGVRSGSNRASFVQAEATLYRNEIIPSWRMFLGAWNAKLAKRYEDSGDDKRLEFDIDLSGIEPLLKDRLELLRNNRNEFESGLITRKEYRKPAQYDEDASGADGDRFYMRSNVVPTGDSSQGENADEQAPQVIEGIPTFATAQEAEQEAQRLGGSGHHEWRGRFVAFNDHNRAMQVYQSMSDSANLEDIMEQ